MGCHWLDGLRSHLLRFILNLQVPKCHWMASDLSVTPELVCSNRWAPEELNVSGSCPALPTAVLLGVASPTCQWWFTHSRGAAGMGGRKAVQGKKASTLWFPPWGAWPFPTQGSCSSSVFGKRFLSEAARGSSPGFLQTAPRHPGVQRAGILSKTLWPHLLPFPSNTLSTELHIAPTDGGQMVLLKVSLTWLLNLAQRLPRKFSLPTPSYI